MSRVALVGLRQVALVGFAILALGSAAVAQAPSPVALAARESYSPEAAAQVQEGDAAMGKSDFRAAVAGYARAVELAPGSVLPRLLLGVALSSSGRLKLAVDQYQAARKLAEDDVLTAFLLYGALESHGDAAAAHQLYLETVRDPRFRASGSSSFDADASLSRLQIGLARFPASPILHLLTGDAYQLSDQQPKAERSYRESLRLAPRWIKPRVNLARLLIAQGQPTRAVDILESALRQDPGNVPARTTMGEALVRAGRPREAILTVQSLEHSDSASVLNVLAQANLRTGRLPEAKKYADRAQKSAPNDPSGSVVQGEGLRKQGDFRGAADAYGQALKVSRSIGLFEAQPSLLRSLAETQLAAGRPADALSTLKEAMATEPDLTAIWQRLAAQAHEALGDRIAMEESLRAALDADPAPVPQDTLNALARQSLIEKTVAYYLTQRDIARSGVGATVGPGGVTVSGGKVSRNIEVRCLAALGHLYRFQSDAPREVSSRRELCALRGTGTDWLLLAQAQERSTERQDALASYRQALSRGGLSAASWSQVQARIKALESRP